MENHWYPLKGMFFSHLEFVVVASETRRRLEHEPALHPSGTSSLQGTKNTGEILVKLDVSQSFIHKF